MTNTADAQLPDDPRRLVVDVSGAIGELVGMLQGVQHSLTNPDLSSRINTALIEVERQIEPKLKALLCHCQKCVDLQQQLNERTSQMPDATMAAVNAMADRDAADRWRRVRAGETLESVYDSIHPDHIGARDADARRLADACLDQQQAADDVIGDLRRKLAIAGVEGSPPPGRMGEIPELIERLRAERARSAALVEALEAFLARYDNHMVNADLLFSDVADKARAALAAYGAAKGTE